MNAKLSPLALLLALAAVAAGCQKSQQAVEQAQKSAEQAGQQVAQVADQAVDRAQAAAEDLANATETQRARLQRRMERRLHRLDAELERLETRVAVATGQAKTDGDKALADLKAKRAAVAKQVDDLGTKSGAAWSDLAQGLRQAMRDLKSAAADAKSRFD